MENGDETERTSPFWLILPFIITGGFLIPMLVYGLKHDEDPTYWFIFLPGVALCIFPVAKLLSLGIQACFKFGLFYCYCESFRYWFRSDYTLDPEFSAYRGRAQKWVLITLLTWIVVFLAVLVSTSFSAKARRGEQPKKSLAHGTSPSSSEGAGTEYRHEERVKSVDRDVVRAFLEGSSTHERLLLLDKLSLAFVPLPFVAMLAAGIFLIKSLLGKWWKSDRKTPLHWKIVVVGSIACFILPILASFRILDSMTTILRSEVVGFLRGVSDEATVTVNAQAASNPRELISALAKLGPLMAHHSHPTVRIEVLVVDNNRRLILNLGRDSDRPQEYWVFYPGYRVTRLNEIGRITTTLFDDY
ncbi:MAG: hypothetical protein ACYTEL_21585 [Planctomycetota bacterium]